MTLPPWTIEASYDQVAQQYTEAFFEELARKPFDRQLLDTFAERIRRRGMVCDLGCGPGHVARGLGHITVDTCGKHDLLTFLAGNRIEIYQSCNLRRTLFWQNIDLFSLSTAHRVVQT
jgi:hypothetical protein